MTIHVLVEGPSDEVLLDGWLPRVLTGTAIKVHRHQGKGQLPTKPGPPDPKRRGVLDQLPAKLRAFAKYLEPTADAVLILIDLDDEDRAQLTTAIQSVIADFAGSVPAHLCLAIEETEAFYLGDLKALRKAFPDANMERARAYEPDSICGTAELFGAIVGDQGLNKVAWAETIGPVLTTRKAESRSPSFKGFVDILESLQSGPAPPTQPKRRYRHPPKNKAEPGRRRR